MKVDGHQGEPTRQDLVKRASEDLIKAFERVMNVRMMEEDLDTAANRLMELGVQPFHVIRPTRSFKDPLDLDEDVKQGVLSRLALMRKVCGGNDRFEEELRRASILGWVDGCNGVGAFPGCRPVLQRDVLADIASLARSMRTATSSIDGSEVVPGREGFLLSSHSRKVIERNLNSIHMWNSPKRTFSPGFQTAPTSATWSYWFDWLYFLMDHPFGEAFHEPPQCMNCGRCLDDIGVQECPGCGEDPWQWWFQWFYARHAPEDLTDRSWDLFQLHTYADGRIFHPRTEGWISSLTHIPIQEEGRFRLEVASKAVVAAPGMLTVADGLAELGIWHSIAFGPFPATSIGHTSYFDMKGNPVEYAHRSPFEQLVMRETMDGREGSVDVDMMPGVDRYTIRDQCLHPSGEAIIGVSTLRTSEIKDGRERWTALTPIIDGPGAFIVREEVTYILEDPQASGYRSISPNYNGQVGGWFEPLVYRVIGPIC